MTCRPTFAVHFSNFDSSVTELASSVGVTFEKHVTKDGSKNNSSFSEFAGRKILQVEGILSRVIVDVNAKKFTRAKMDKSKAMIDITANNYHIEVEESNDKDGCPHHGVDVSV